MRCWNCGKKIPDTAKVCRICEAAVEEESSTTSAAAAVFTLCR